MTDRYAGFLVTLEENTREDDAEATIAAIKQIRGVASVAAIVATVEIDIAETRARIHWATRILALIRGES